MKSKYNTVVLLSGGMDSTTVLATALSGNSGYGPLVEPSEILGLSFDYGQRHRYQELQAAWLIASHYQIDHEVIDLNSLGKLLGGSALTDDSIAVPDGHYAAETMRATVVPNRNAIMLSIAFGIARAASALRVECGTHAGDHHIYPDCRLPFIRAYQRAMTCANEDLPDLEKPILITPFISMTKAQIVTEGTRLGVPYGITYSCYKGGIYHCGTCGTCTERKEAFELAGIVDPTPYEQDSPTLVKGTL